ncbi:MAG: anaerobic ribonucleoside-triphosphate reductase activating protein [Burkholderiales bacterium]|nr:anaerobic ribonucleoside-triphosphate reductase activating protein [Burkholderiales bacterium]
MSSSEQTRLPAHALKVGGMTAFSATDFPGKFATTIFIQGCPWRCSYCHNPHLQERAAASAIHWEDILLFLRRRRGFIDVVVFSGGEPCIDPALYAAIQEVKEMGFAIGLHTACIYPRQLQQVLPLIDWVGFDVKTRLPDYPALTSINKSGASILPCIEQILASGVDYECRTTFHPSLLDETALLELGRQLCDLGVKNYVVQQFRPIGCQDQALNLATQPSYPSASSLKELASYFPRFAFRAH